MNATRVAVIMENRVLAECLAFRIAAERDFRVVATDFESQTGIQHGVDSEPDVVILNADSPNPDTLAVVEGLGKTRPQTQVVLLSVLVSDILIEQALRLGVRGYLTVAAGIDTILDGIRHVAAGGHCFSNDVKSRLTFDPSQRRFRVAAIGQSLPLTRRQLEVLRHLARGCSTKEVARLMGLCTKSVESHKFRIMNKLDLHDRVALARYAIREGLVLP